MIEQPNFNWLIWGSPAFWKPFIWFKSLGWICCKSLLGRISEYPLLGDSWWPDLENRTNAQRSPANRLLPGWWFFRILKDLHKARRHTAWGPLCNGCCATAAFVFAAWPHWWASRSRQLQHPRESIDLQYASYTITVYIIMLGVSFNPRLSSKRTSTSYHIIMHFVTDVDLWTLEDWKEWYWKS